MRGWIGDYSSLWSRYALLFRSWTDLATIDEGVGDQIRRMVTALDTLTTMVHRALFAPGAGRTARAGTG